MKSFRNMKCKFCVNFKRKALSPICGFAKKQKGKWRRQSEWVEEQEERRTEEELLSKWK